MADIFLSYKREDRARAELIVATLRSEGRTVWWDEGLTPRQAWDSTIEQEIAAAAKVIVLWSTRSVASDWVRSEAHYAQNHAKLVPVLIEPCTVPLAFMLRQAVDLTHWRGEASDPSWRKLADWLDKDEPLAESPAGADQRARPVRRRAGRAAAVAAATIAAALAVGFLVHPSTDRHTDATSIRVASFDTIPGDHAAESFSQGFAADLAQIATSGGSKLRVYDGAGAGASSTSSSDFILNGTVRSLDGNLRATLTLNAADGAIMWSSNLARPVGQVEAMHHEAEVRMAAVFVCALDATARDRNIVSLDALKIYLQACELMPSDNDLRTRDLLREVTTLAPDFAQGWGTLAEWNASIYEDTESADASILRQEVLDGAARALAIDRRNSEAWVARSMVKKQISEWPEAQSDLAQALTLRPNDSLGNFYQAVNLLNVGRTNEALDYAVRAANSGPQFLPKTQRVISTLADLGRVDDAMSMLSAALKTWPDVEYLKDFGASTAARYADATRAASILGDASITDAIKPARLQLLRLEAEARLHPSSASIAAAAVAIREQFGGADDAFGAAFNFIVIGQIDEAYSSISKMTTPLLNLPYDDNPEIFFRPVAAKFRADPRFMPLAAKLGLVKIWQTTKWPDFCTARDRPYDCRAVAATLARQ